LVCYDPGRVRILIDYRPALRQRTGVGHYVHGLATALATRLPREDSLTLFSSSWKDRLGPSVIPGSSQVDARVPVGLLNVAWHRLEWPPVGWLAGTADIVQSMHPLMIPATGAARFITIHDLYFLDYPEHTSSEIRRDYPALAADHARRADGIIVNSEHTKRQVVERLKVAAEKVTVCTPGNPGWPRRAEAASVGPILFLGTLEPRKNLHRLLEAYALLLERRPDTPDLVLAGALGSPSSDLFSGPVSLARAIDRVRITGYVSDDERQRLYAEASMLVLPSLEEGFGIPALEAMTIGLPVVASNRGALPEVIGSAGLLVDPEDANALAAAIARVLDEPALRRQMSEQGAARAAQFTWQLSAERLYEAYRGAWLRRLPG
jgi:glycosyltransferase involved in cell wall biosynthesis